VQKTWGKSLVMSTEYARVAVASGSANIAALGWAIAFEIACADSAGRRLYFLDAPNSRIKVEIIKLSEYLKDRLGITFEIEPTASPLVAQRS
jgi:hypothetical protein